MVCMLLENVSLTFLADALCILIVLSKTHLQICLCLSFPFPSRWTSRAVVVVVAAGPVARESLSPQPEFLLAVVETPLLLCRLSLLPSMTLTKNITQIIYKAIFFYMYTYASIFVTRDRIIIVGLL